MFTLIYSTSNFILSCSDTRNDHELEEEKKEFPANCSLNVSQLSGPCRKRIGAEGLEENRGPSFMWFEKFRKPVAWHSARVGPVASEESLGRYTGHHLSPYKPMSHRGVGESQVKLGQGRLACRAGACGMERPGEQSKISDKKEGSSGKNLELRRLEGLKGTENPWVRSLGKTLVPCFLLSALEIGYPTEPEFRWRTVSLRVLTLMPTELKSQVHTATPASLCGCWGSKLRSSSDHRGRLPTASSLKPWNE